ncbi:MAG: GerW family sporulation protein [Bacteroidia bacterium]|nr:GerW family sporulation protein [Bacteroidia bacterium]
MNKLEEVLDKVTDFLKTEAKTETIIGKEFKLGEFTCVPVISMGVGFGGGSGEGKGNAKGAGEGEGTGVGGAAGLGMGPVGFLVTKGNEIQFVPTRTSKGLSATFEKIPDLLEKFLDKKKN